MVVKTSLTGDSTRKNRRNTGLRGSYPLISSVYHAENLTALAQGGNNRSEKTETQTERGRAVCRTSLALGAPWPALEIRDFDAFPGL